MLLLTYPLTTLWFDYRVVTALLYGLPALLCALFLLLTAVRFLWYTRCSLAGKMIALVTLLVSTLMLINLCLLAIAILFFVIVAVVMLVVSQQCVDEYGRRWRGWHRGPRW